MAEIDWLRQRHSDVEDCENCEFYMNRADAIIGKRGKK
jgi:hypothetical protein